MLPRRSKYFKKEVESKYFTNKLLRRPEKKEPNKRGNFEKSSSDCSAGDYKPQRKSELLLNIERYNEIHPSHHVINKRLIGRRGLFPYGIRTNICERKNLDPVYKANAAQNIENIISTVKSKSPETRVKFGTPNAASTGRRWLGKNTVISPIEKVELTYNNDNGNKKNDVVSRPNVIGLLAACNKNPNNDNCKKMPELITSNNLKSQVQALKCTLLRDQEPKKRYETVANKSPEFEEMCNMYVEFVDSICEVVSSANDKLSPKEDYTNELYKRLRNTIVNSRRSSPKKKPPPATLDVNDKTTNSISNCCSAPSSSVNDDFVFKPVLISSNKARGGVSPARVLIDSFELPVQDNDNSNNDSLAKADDDSLNFSKLSEMEVDEFSSPELSRVYKKRRTNNNRNRSERRRVSFLDSSSGQLNQADKYDDGEWTSEDSFRCSNKKCFKM